MTTINLPQNPGIGGLDELTSAEELTLQSISALGNPGADRILFWDNSESDWGFLSAGTGINITGTTITATGSGDVSKVGTPVNNQVGVWTGDGTLEGDAALTFDTTTDVLSSGGLLLSGLTASEIVGTDASKNLVSLAVATYPSLTELTYVKGVTSAIQTQIDGKSPTAGNASLITVGTITTGVWNGTDIAVADGGTGASTLTGILIGAGTAAVVGLALTAGKSIRRNAGDTAYEEFTPGTGTLSNVSEDTSPTLGGALDAGGFDINNGGVIFLTEQAAAEVDVAGKGQLWVLTATPNVLKFTDDAGTDFTIAHNATTSLPSLGTVSTSLTGVLRADSGVLSVDTDVTDLVDNLAVSQLADGTDGELITWSAAGAPATVATGNAGQVLTSNGVGTAPTFQAAAGGGANTALSNLASVAINLTLVSDTDNTDALGTTAIAWSDLFLGSGAVITFNSAPSTADITITHSADTLTFAGGTIVLGTATATGGLTGNVTGNVTGSAATVTGAAQTAITSLGTLTALTVDNLVLDLNTISSTSGNINITPVAGSNITLDGTVTIDAGVVAGMTSLTMSGNVIMAANSITMTGSIAATGARVTKGWFTDIESTNMPTVGGTAILTSLTAPQFTTIELGHATENTLSASSGVLSIEGTAIPKGSGTINEISYWSGANTLGALAVATYPSLTELTYVKGVTSAIQTQLAAKLALAGGTMTGNIVLGENTSVDLDPAGSADGKYSGVCITGTAGTALAFGDLIYLAVADSRWELADADALATAGNVLIGMCVLAAGADGNATKILLQGQIRADAQFPALTIGAAVYVGETAGAIQVAIPTGADNVIRVVGFALTADEIYLNPSQDHQTTVA